MIPQIKPDDHVQAGETGNRRRDPSLYAELPFNSLEIDGSLCRNFDFPHCRQQYGDHERNSADP